LRAHRLLKAPLLKNKNKTEQNPKLGFRSTRVARGRLLHNGVALMLRGVNRHEWHERWGRWWFRMMCVGVRRSLTLPIHFILSAPPYNRPPTTHALTKTPTT
jgi:hypothetical protein